MLDCDQAADGCILVGEELGPTIYDPRAEV